jgi:spermidine synthase
MVYQQVWARLLSLVIGSSVHAVAVILALFLLGLAAGSAVYSRRTVLVPGQALNLAVVHCAVALWGVATIRLADQLPAAFVVGLSLTGISVPSVVAVQVAVAGALVVPPTFFMGMTFPATLRLVEQGRGDLGTGRAVGWTYWGNTVGAIAGSFVGGFVVLPALGAQGAMVACTLASLVLAAGYSGLGARITGPRRAAGHAIATVLISVALPAAYHPWNLAALSSGVFRVSRSGELAQALGHLGTGPEPASEAVSPRLTPWIARARSLVQPRDIWDEGLGPVDAPRMLFHEAGVAATVAVTETAARSILEGHDWVTYSLRVNGKADASLTVLSGVPPDDPAAISPQGDAETQTLSGVLAFLLHPGRPRSALVIGWGSGLTAGSALATGLGSVRAVEIERRVVEGSTPFQPYAGSPLLDPRLELIEDDGRRLLAAREDRYDIIVSEPSNPWISGCSNLFTVEFFQLVASRLNRGGRFLQWVQAYEISPRTMASILASVSAVFRSVVVFQPTHSPSDLLIVAGQDEVRLDFEAMASRITTPRVASRLEPFGIFGPEDVAARLVLGEHEVARVIRGAGLNTDDNLVVELAAPFDLVRFRDASGPRLLSSLGVIPARLPDDLAGREGVVGEGLEPALARAGRSRRDAPYLPPPDAATELLALDAARTGSPRPPGASPPSTEQLAADLDPDREEALGLALLGLAAANEGQSRLAMLLLLAHLRSAAPPVRAAREVLAAWSWESGIYPRAWMLRHGPVIPSPPDPPRTSGRPASLFQNPF